MKKLLVALLIALALPATAASGVPGDIRFCGAPARDKDGTIHRSQAVLRAFQKRYPCPANGKTTGACPGWAIDHVIPLACGGCDAMHNLQWLPSGLKSAAVIGKDRFERKIYETSVECSNPAK